jgi:phosphate-selective porin OprO/OprP
MEDSQLRAVVVAFLACSGQAGADEPPPAPAVSASAPQAAETGAPVDDTGALRAQIEALDRRLRIAERRLEVQGERVEAENRAPPVTSVGPSGFSWTTRDRLFGLRLRGLVQVDGRAYVGPGSQALTDTFLLRRVRPIVEATFAGVIDVKIMPDFGMGQVVIYDAYVDLHPWPWLRIRGGKFKPPVGLERLQSASNLLFVERGYPTALVPNRDVGVQLWGEIASGTINYAIGVFNGVPDGALGDLDNNDGKDFAGRLFVHPLRPLRNPWLTYLGVGLAGTWGRQKGTTSAPNLPTYKSEGQNTFFSYIADPMTGTAIAAGDRWRAAPQLYYYGGPFGLLAEYVMSDQTVSKGAITHAVANQAWQVECSFVLTMEDASYDGVIPRRPLSIARRQFGAFELGFRYDELWVNDLAFPDVADPLKSARIARSFSGAFNWYLTQNARFMLNYARTDFVKGGPMGTDRPSENAILGRLQASF